MIERMCCLCVVQLSEGIEMEQNDMDGMSQFRGKCGIHDEGKKAEGNSESRNGKGNVDVMNVSE